MERENIHQKKKKFSKISHKERFAFLSWKDPVGTQHNKWEREKKKKLSPKYITVNVME